jgi:hypothetical protein
MRSCVGVQGPCPGVRGAEGPGKHKGVAVRWGLKDAWNEWAGRGTRTEVESWRPGRFSCAADFCAAKRRASAARLTTSRVPRVSHVSRDNQQRLPAASGRPCIRLHHRRSWAILRTLVQLGSKDYPFRLRASCIPCWQFRRLTGHLLQPGCTSCIGGRVVSTTPDVPMRLVLSSCLHAIVRRDPTGKPAAPMREGTEHAIRQC